MEVLIKLDCGGILLQCIRISNHHTVLFKYLTILSIMPQLGEKKDFGWHCPPFLDSILVPLTPWNFTSNKSVGPDGLR